MERLLDPSLSDNEFVTLLDQTMQVLYTSTRAEERNLAQNVLTELQNVPDAWVRVDKVLDSPTTSSPAKFYALQVMESMIRYRWKTLPRTTSEQVRNFIVNKVIELSRDEQTLARERAYVGKLNLILVQIVKQEWPANWRTFISEIVGASKSSVSLCENNMHILSLLSEEVFEFSTGQMTQDKTIELKNQFNEEFSHVFQLCQYVFGLAAELQDSRPSLLVATLRTLERFLSWIPLGYIFETQLIETLTGFILQPLLRRSALRCLVEIGSLSVGNVYDGRFVTLYMTFMNNLCTVLPVGTDIANAYIEADDETQNFVMDLALFLTSFFRLHLNTLADGSLETRQALMTGNEYLVKISTVEDLEVFKACLEWWHHLSEDLYESETVAQLQRGPLVLNASHDHVSARKELFAPVLSAVRRIMVSRMAKPEEVVVVEDENGEIVRETTKDTDAIALYKTMRETLVFLTHLNTEDSEAIIVDKLNRQIDGSEWSWAAVSSLCWAIGSISGAMNEEEEKRFLVQVIKDLLGLTEMKRGKDNKAVVASNIMYVVGQYPRFLRAHWKFLKTVVNKLFEFMHESHPGVQDMACDTFLTISQKCRRKFVGLQIGETKPFIVEILENLSEIINELEPHQVQSFYESCGCIISCAQDESMRNQLIARLFELPNQSWRGIIQSAGVASETLRHRDVMKNIVNILKTNERAAASLGGSYIFQLKEIYDDMLRLYQVYSDYISTEVATGGPMAMKKADTRNMRAVKKEVLRVVESFLSAAEEHDRPRLLAEVVERMTEPILLNYRTSIADARDAEVLSLFAQVITFMGGLPDPAIRLIFQSVFGVTLEMVTQNFEDYPDARLQFFNLLRAINVYNFPVLFSLDSDPAKAEQEFRLVINAIVCALKHTEKNVAETGLQILLELLQNVESSQYVNYFYKTYFKLILNEILAVLTDTLHRPGFKRHVQILAQLLKVVLSGRVTEPMWDPQSQEEATLASFGESSSSNPTFVRAHMMKLLSSAFPNMSEGQVIGVVKGMMEITDERILKSHVRDFLVQTKEFAGGDNTDLFDEERQAQLAEEQKAVQERLMRTPGLIPPVHTDDGMSAT